MPSTVTSECFVYLMLPGTGAFVTAGRFVLGADRNGVPLGRFVYGRRYLAREDAVPLDPTELPLTERTYETDRLRGVFGALRDGSPDFWGRRVIDKHARVAQLSEVDYLLHSPDDRAGALSFGLNLEPPAPLRKFNRMLDLDRLLALADRVIAEPDTAASEANEELAGVQDLLLLRTSMGGARPKVVVENDGALWLAKFNRADDPWNSARVEHAMLILARECGLSTADSRVIQAAGRDVLLVKRFDREAHARGYYRARMLSALTLLRTGDAHQDRDSWSYLRLAEELRRVSARPADDARELFGRMVFNALITNIDDHPRNHAVIAPRLEWRLSPAYDLTPLPAVSAERRDLALTIGDYGRYANASNLLSQCARFLLSRAEAARIIDDCEARVRERWYAVARGTGVTEADCEKISRAFAYAGFRLSLPPL
ncbi:MAG TPA: type II toxin-antitoxin system HipA family toxin [Dehalococcoidia bacterium]|nr:type II toxin-antitoxin system HipA family toxin [Dehalococcoidia bacterium]